MPKIVTITFSPCIDKSTSIPFLLPEKKLPCACPKLEPGGGGINVSRAIKKLGGESVAVFPSGGYTGKTFNHLLQQENISSIIINTVNETRENIIVLDTSTNNQYRFGMPGPLLLEDEWRQCLQTVQELKDVEYIVASGSLPPGVPVDIYAQLAVIAHAKAAKLIVDTSGEPLKYALSAGVYMIKPNLSELSILAGEEQITIQNVVHTARKILLKVNCHIMVVSMGIDGAIMITKDEVFHAMPPAVNRKSTVGAGDSMVAGIVYSLFNGVMLKDALSFGVACGTAATMNAGTELCRLEDANKLFEAMKKEAQMNHLLART